MILQDDFENFFHVWKQKQSDEKKPGRSVKICRDSVNVFEKVDYPRKDNSNYPYSFFSNLLPLLISAIGKLNKINILFENHRVFGVFTMWEN